MEDVIDKIVRELCAVPGQSKNEGSKAGCDPGKECSALECSDCSGCLGCVEHKAEAVNNIVACGADRIACGLGIRPKNRALGKMIDHTLLKPDATKDDLETLCDEAKEYGFASVCVNPFWVRLCAERLRRSDVKVCTVVGFPLGSTSARSKSYETRFAIEDGAQEIDMVVNIGALKSGDYDAVRKDIRGVIRSAGRSAKVKVILETCLLSNEEKIKGSVIAKQCGAAFVKTSTGFSKGGATAEDVALMRRVVGEGVGVKASGGVRSYEDALKMIQSGATRIGASASVKIVTGGTSGNGY